MTTTDHEFVPNALKKASYFKMYFLHWIASESTQRMSFAAKGMFIELLVRQPVEGSLSADLVRLRRSIGANPKEFGRCWAELETKFVPVFVSGEARLVNMRLHEICGEIITERRGKSNGAKGIGIRKDVVGDPVFCEDLSEDTCEKFSRKPALRDESESSLSLSLSSDALDSKPNAVKVSKRKSGDPPEFAAFYESYPNKTARAVALTSWLKINPGPELVTKILAAVEAQKKGDQWLRDGGQYVPMPSTWLNQHRWEDRVRPGGSSGRKGDIASPPGFHKPTKSDEEFDREEAEFKILQAEAESLGIDVLELMNERGL